MAFLLETIGAGSGSGLGLKNKLPEVGSKTTNARNGMGPTCTLNPGMDFHGSCTFLNMSGDVTITWDEKNREAMIEAVRAMMAKGYSFFTTKKVVIEKIQRRTKVTEKNIEKIDKLIVTDAQFDEILQAIKDPIVADVVKENKAQIGKRKSKDKIETSKRASTAEEVVDSHSVAIRPVHGG